MSQKDLIIALHVIPKASKNEVVGWVDDANGQKALKVKVTAAPEDGKANKAVITLLAKTWGCAARDLEIAGGATSRHKKLKIHSSSLSSHIAALMS
jgi:uncharacterized protein (TIGR00251 family)